MEKKYSYDRYQRQIILPGFGKLGQEKLLDASVLVIGAGGLGCPALQYLAAAGIGTIGIVDDDLVQLNNLHRQVLFSVSDIGLSKAETATRKLRELNPEINILTFNNRLTNENTFEILSEFDIIIDGTDNFSTRYMVNDACVLLSKPLVYGAISQFEGQVSVFNFPNNDGEVAVNYRDIFPDPAKEDEILNCADAGVIGTLPGIIGSMMANEVIKMITGIGEVLAGQLLVYNALNNQVFLLSLSPLKDTRSLIPKDKHTFLETDYAWLCSSSMSEMEIDIATFNQLLATKKPDIIDVREIDETPELTEFVSVNIPLGRLAENTDKILSDTVVVFCQSGKRSLMGAKILTGIFGSTKKIYSFKGGILEWKKQNPGI